MAALEAAWSRTNGSDVGGSGLGVSARSGQSATKGSGRVDGFVRAIHSTSSLRLIQSLLVRPPSIHSWASFKMYQPEDLDAAVSAGVLERDTAERFRDFAARQTGRLPADDEHFRLLTGATDIFASIGAVLLLFGVYVATRSDGLMMGACFVAMSWIMAEYLVRQRKMLLPGFVLLAAFEIGVALVAFRASLALPGPQPIPGQTVMMIIANSLTPLRYLPITIALAGAALLFWHRFALPISCAVCSLALCNVPDCLIAIADPQLQVDMQGVTTLICGFGILGAAILWDMSDIYRQTKRSDVAFWLHALAAFIIANVGFRLALGMPVSARESPATFSEAMMTLEIGSAVCILAIYGTFVIIALIINRRALLFAGLIFAFSAFATLSGASHGSQPVIVGALALGIVILAATLGWAWLRRLVLSMLPLAIRAQVPRADWQRPRPRPVE
jgi:hypothetical protein